MRIREVSNKRLWEDFVLSTEWTPFFQSWQFGEAMKEYGYGVKRFWVEDNGKPVLGSQIFEIRAKRGDFLHLRHGPVFQNFSKEAFVFFLNFLKKYAEEKRFWWIRISPLLDASYGDKFFRSLGFIPAPVPNQDAENCLVIDFSQSLEQIFRNFKKNTRNLIRKAEKLGVEIVESIKEEDFKVFLEIYNQTAKRQKFVPHFAIQEEFRALKEDNNLSLFLGKHQGKILSAALIVFYGKQAVYHHSGSIPSKVPVNYLLQWKVIQTAKEKGFKFYNLWGVSPEENKKHPWWGLSRFKRGFGGEEKNFLHALDLPLSKKYYFSFLYQLLWKKFRGY